MTESSSSLLWLSVPGRVVRTTPLDDFLDETLTLLRDRPDAKEIVVERAKFVRHAEANGTYDDVLTMLAGV
ncbi:hypothetical protein [Streptomyces umbrinus]|uniref:hypothetical protein n=1 Tax=Streptomyces umbrinus TaxID=67370 RepID=UPI003C2E83C0